MHGQVNANTVLIIRNLWEDNAIIEISFNSPGLKAFWINERDEERNEVSTAFEISQGISYHVIADDRRNVLLYNNSNEVREYDITLVEIGAPLSLGSVSATSGF